MPIRNKRHHRPEEPSLRVTSVGGTGSGLAPRAAPSWSLMSLSMHLTWEPAGGRRTAEDADCLPAAALGYGGAFLRKVPARCNRVRAKRFRRVAKGSRLMAVTSGLHLVRAAAL